MTRTKFHKPARRCLRGMGGLGLTTLLGAALVAGGSPVWAQSGKPSRFGVRSKYPAVRKSPKTIRRAPLRRTAQVRPLRTARMTNFDPKKHGFQFVNNFKNDFIPALDIRTGGLCGGMSYSALDYYFAKRAVPNQPWRPGNRTTLQSYLYNRQVSSIKANLRRWADIGLNPFGKRDTTLFQRGLKGELSQLRATIDKGIPAPLGMQGHDSGNHQVVAIGYDLGPKKAPSDLKIFVYDPNYPNEIRTLVPDLRKKLFVDAGKRSRTWRTYFVDRKYRAARPPAIRMADTRKDGRIGELVLKLETGRDDLRGGNDNLNLTINLTDGSQWSVPNINRRARWLSKYVEFARVPLRRRVKPGEIKSLVLRTTSGGGIGGDNWDMKLVCVMAMINGEFKEQAKAGPHRFKHHNSQFTIPVAGKAKAARGQATTLVLEFRTGGDDLRGGNDNVNVAIHFRNGRVQNNANVNRGRRWRDNRTTRVVLSLNKPVYPRDISELKLSTTFRGGIGGDNWNMASLKVRAVGNGVNKVIATAGPKRFTGRSRTLTVRTGR